MNAEYRKIENAGPAGLLSQRFYTPGALTVTTYLLLTVQVRVIYRLLCHASYEAKEIGGSPSLGNHRFLFVICYLLWTIPAQDLPSLGQD